LQRITSVNGGYVTRALRMKGDEKHRHQGLDGVLQRLILDQPAVSTCLFWWGAC
jgi:hypothetical protein